MSDPEGAAMRQYEVTVKFVVNAESNFEACEQVENDLLNLREFERSAVESREIKEYQ